MKIGFLLLAMMLVAGCAKKQPSPWLETVTQVSTYEALQAGRYEGQLAISNLLVVRRHRAGHV
jgi:hypothetical protein